MAIPASESDLTATTFGDTTYSRFSLGRLIAWLLFIASAAFFADRVYFSGLRQPAVRVETETKLTNKDWADAMVALDQGEVGPAELFIERSRGKKEFAARRSLLEGRRLLEKGKYLACQQAFLEALDDKPLRPLVLHWLAAANYAVGNAKDAEKLWLQALSEDPQIAIAHRSLSMFYYDLGAMDNAIFHLEELAKIDTKDGRPLRLLGLINKDYERYEDSVGFYDQALQRRLSDSSKQEVLAELTESLIKVRNYDRALATITTAVETSNTLALKAECLSGLGKNDEAKSALEKALSIDGGNLRARLLLGTVSLEAGDAVTAANQFRLAIALAPMDYAAHFKLSQALRRLQKTEEADREATEAERIKKLRELFASQHQKATAEPENVQVRLDLAKTAEDLQMPDLALSWYRAVLQLDPKNEEASAKIQR